MTATASPVPVQKSLRQRLIGFNLLTAIILGVAGYWIGDLIGNALGHLASTDYFSEEAGQNDIAIFLGYFFGVIGFLIGLGFANYPVRRMLGHPASRPDHDEITGVWVGDQWHGSEPGIWKYLRMSTDHKIVALQYLGGIGVFFAIAGLNAMLIRTELLSPSTHVFGANQYLTLVGLHGTMMMGMMTSSILGPFANWVVPLMIGTRRLAFPRIEALTFWLLMAAGVILLTTIFFGGFQTGWTGYEPLSDQGTAGFDAYIGFFSLVGLSMCLLGLNLLVTIVTMRAPGVTWSRLPIFCWSVVATCVLMVLASPMLIACLLMGAMDRTAQTAFFIPGNGGSAQLYQNLFWVFGHPEVYVVAIPGFGIVLELLPVFTRKPLWGYRTAVAGVMGVALLSFFVWQHHLFVSGIDADLRPFFMLSTEMISLPTGFTFLCVLGTLWRGRIRLTVPMLFCMGWAFNFLWGGISGVFLSDVPSDVGSHGSFFSMAHFHYTIMGGLIFTFFAAIYYWGPKMTGFKFSERLGKWHFWLLFVAFNSTFGPLFALGMLGMPRRVVTYPSSLQSLNDWVSISAFVIGVSMLVFLWNMIRSLVIKPVREEANPWQSKSPEFQLPTPLPSYDFVDWPDIGPEPYPYGEPQEHHPGAVAPVGGAA
jgi:cytochrome c oxidase subunit 1